MASELQSLAALFLRLGATSFGGPAVHIAMMEEEVVRLRGWMTRDELLDLVAASNLIPGPNSTELAIHIGYRRAGWRGLIVAGTCFIVPAMLAVFALAWAYVEFGRAPTAVWLLYGVKPVVIAVVADALLRLSRSALKTPTLAIFGALALAGRVFLGIHELALLAIFAVAGILAWRLRPVPRTSVLLLVPALPDAATTSSSGALTLAAGGTAAAAAGGAFTYSALFFVFLKIGSVLFGSGYVLLAFLRTDLVERFGWLTEAQLLDAVAAGQITPGPVFTTATFIGYVVAGVPGGLIATLGIFLPAFFFVALSAPFLPRLRASRLAASALDGVVVASLALMAAVSWELARDTVIDVPTAVIAAASLAVLLHGRVSSTWLVVCGALLGLAAGRWTL